MNLRDIDDAEKFQKHFVTPLIDAVRAEVRPLVERVGDQEERIKRLESNQRRALAGVAAAATTASVLFGLGLDWVRKKLGLM